MYDKKLKRGKDGLFTRYAGQNTRGTPEKFRLGYEPEVAPPLNRDLGVRA